MTTDVIVIAGPTASGKTDLSLALAERLAARTDQPVWLLSADAMCVYQGMTIGTAKPSADQQRGLPHFGIDLCDPSVDHSLAEWLVHARQVVADARVVGARLIVVGGTGLYVHGLVDNLQLPGQFPEARESIEQEPDTLALHTRLAELDPVAAAKMEPTNRRRIVRALEVTVGSGRPFSSFGPGMAAFPTTDWAMLAVELERPVLDQRIANRIDRQIEAGWVAETQQLLSRPLGWSKTARQALGYSELASVVEGVVSLDDAKANIAARTKSFARRQQRWFGRDPRFEWVSMQGDRWSDELVDSFAAKFA
jgi:tRNA dimethylallyltransferase